jgi:hypothetical protein
MNGEILTEADFDRMAEEAARAEPNYEAIEKRALSKGGRPLLRSGISLVLQVRIDENLRQQLVERAERDHTTPLRAWHVMQSMSAKQNQASISFGRSPDSKEAGGNSNSNALRGNDWQNL